MKDLNWLRREVHKELEAWCGVEGGIDGDGINEIMLLINQLDEPDTLTPEWIDENITQDDIKGNGYVAADTLYGILVPKQELPVIPKFVAEYLDFAKSDVPLMRVLEIANTRNELPKWEKEYDWISANDETFARAWLDGYTIKKEPKYYVLNNEGETMIRKDDSGVRTSSGFKIDNRLNNEGYKFTEQEIKDYDERYWPFAVKVEELEE